MDAPDAYDQWHARIGECETETNRLERALLGKVMCNPWLFPELSAAMRCEDFTKQPTGTSSSRWRPSATAARRLAS